jgi:hypothetical protein
MAIMQVQKWLIDDEISEKKAGLLLYSLQLAATNVGKTTFGQAKDEDLAEEVGEVEEVIQMERQRVEDEKRLEEIRKTLPLINTDEHGSGIGGSGHREIGTSENQNTPLMNADDADRKNPEEELPRMNADERGSGIGESGHLDIGTSENQNTPLMNADDADRKNPEEELPRMNADERGSGIGESGHRDIGTSENRNTPLMNTDDADRKNPEEELPRMNADERGSGIGGAGVYANRGANAEVHANLG